MPPEALPGLPVNGYANLARYILAGTVAVVILIVGLWDAWMYFCRREDLTVTAIFRGWFAADPTLIVLASLLFFHLVIQR